MRCKNCGSTNITTETKQKSRFSWGKGFLGSLLFGSGGAVAGVNGKTKTTTTYQCMACGLMGDLITVMMDGDVEGEIESALRYNNVSKLKNLKSKYRNIEWTPPMNGNGYPQTYGVTTQDSDDYISPFDVENGALKKYRGKGPVVFLPERVTSIGDSAFERCETITTVYISNNVKSIGGSAFSFCAKLNSITIPNSIKSIGGSAFEGCVNLESIIIPESVTFIDSSAFAKCKKLASVTIPNSVTYLGSSAFSDCESLTSIDLPEHLTAIKDNTFLGCENLISVKLPKKLTSIGDSAFASCKKLTSIEIPDGVTSIEDNTFDTCESLTFVSIPNSVTSIGEDAFAFCENLESIEIPNSVTSIGAGAFSFTNISSIVIPSSVTSIGDNIFASCYALETITVDSGNKYFRSEGNCLIRIEDNTLVGGCATSVIPEYTTSIGKNAFWGIEISSIVIPKNITSICASAFNSSSLNSITIPRNVSFIGAEAFSNCDDLESIEFSDPHGWVLLTEEDSEGELIDDEILSDPESAAEFIKDLDENSYLCKKIKNK